MPRYFLSVRYKPGPDGLAVDHEGDELPDAGALREHVLETARDLIRGSRLGSVNWYDCTFEVTNEAGQVVITVPFAEAVH
ncbi:MAG: DUF6894 family protein [Gemmatimonadales bacterium]